MSQFDRFTERSRRVLQLSEEEAARYNHNYIGTEHLLLGLVREGDGVAARVLFSMGIQLPRVRSAVEFIIGRGEGPLTRDIRLTPRTKAVLELAFDEGRRLNHHFIGTEHLLLGLIREGEGIAAGVLETLGAPLSLVRANIFHVMNIPDEQVIVPEPSGIVESTATTTFDKFTEQARQVLTSARQEAEGLNNDYIGTEHILLGLVSDEMGPAVSILDRLNVDRRKIRTSVEFIVGGEKGALSDSIAPTPRAKKVLELAIDESRRLKHDFIGTEHLLIGLLREGEGIAAGVFESLGVTLGRVRAAHQELMATNEDQEAK